jgi:mRNA interferase MazF
VLSVPVTAVDRALVALVPHTTSLRGSRFEVQTDARFLQPGAFNVQGLVTVPATKLLRKLGRLGQDNLVAVEAAVRSWLGL